MTTRHRVLGVLTGCMAAALITQGCRDSGADERSRVQAALEGVVGTLGQASAAAITATGDDVATARQKLSGVISTLSGIQGGEEGQQAAKAMMAATAHRGMAALALREASEIESDLANRRAKAARQAEGVVTLAALSRGRQAISTLEPRAELAQADASAQGDSDALMQRLTELNTPITETRDANTADMTEVNRLREEAQRLYREAAERGPSQGFTTFEQAVAVGQQADKLESEIERRDISLGFDLVPEHNLAMSKADSNRAMIDAVQETQRAFDAFDKSSAQDVADVQAMMDRMLGEVRKTLADIKSIQDGDLKEAYEQALADLDKARGQALAAAKLKGADATAAKMLGVRIGLAQGRAHTAKAHGLAAQRAVLEILARAPDASAEAKLEIRAVTSAREEAITDAETALTAALEALSGVNDPSHQAELDSLRGDIEATIESLHKAPAAAVEEFDDPVKPEADGGEPVADDAATGDAPAEAPAETEEAMPTEEPAAEPESTEESPAAGETPDAEPADAEPSDEPGEGDPETQPEAEPEVEPKARL